MVRSVSNQGGNIPFDHNVSKAKARNVPAVTQGFESVKNQKLPHPSQWDWSVDEDQAPLSETKKCFKELGHAFKRKAA